MDELGNYMLKKVAKGGIIIFTGITLSFGIFFFYKVLAARYLGPADYGLLTLGITILNIASIFGLAGVHHGIGKLVNHYLAKKQHGKVKGIIASSFIITITLSIIMFLLLHYSSSFIGEKLFKLQGLSRIISIFSIGVPFSVLTQLLKYYFFALKSPQYTILSESLSEKMLNLMFLIAVMLLSASVYALSWAYVASLVVSSVVGVLIFNSKIKGALKRESRHKLDFKSVISFSLPLMLNGILGVILAWTDTVFIGIFKSDADVGVYNAAYVISSALMIFWLSFGNIFYPIISELYARKAVTLIRKIFETASRWIFILAFPVFIIVLLFPARLLSLVFGQSYVHASLPLLVLIIGYFFTTLFGLSEQGLITFKKTNFLGIITSIALAVNIILNVILIPIYGITGAAIATTITLLAVNSTKFFVFKRILGFSYNKLLYIKVIFSAGIPAIAVLYIAKSFEASTYIFISEILVYALAYFMLLVLFKSFSDEDISLLYAVERKTGLSLSIIKKFLEK